MGTVLPAPRPGSPCARRRRSPGPPRPAVAGPRPATLPVAQRVVRRARPAVPDWPGRAHPGLGVDGDPLEVPLDPDDAGRGDQAGNGGEAPAVPLLGQPAAGGHMPPGPAQPYGLAWEDEQV